MDEEKKVEGEEDVADVAVPVEDEVDLVVPPPEEEEVEEA